MAAVNKLNELAQSIDRELETKLAEIKAADQRIVALRQIEKELTDRIGNHQENLKVKTRLEVIQAAARKFAAGLDEHDAANQAMAEQRR